MIYIYILKLKHGKYYIGKTNNPNIRIGNHFNKRGATWTKRYRPVKIEQIIKTDDHFDEDKWTLKYMDKKGIHNVRGGSFCQMKIAPDMEMVIKRMLNGSRDKCFKCGNSGHFVKDCNNLKIDEILDCIDTDSDSSIDNIEEEDLVIPLDRNYNLCPCSCVVL